MDLPSALRVPASGYAVHPPVGYDIARPDPAGTIQSLSALGYSCEAAVADLVDNSIAAGAGRIDIHLYWAGAEGSWVAISDDGQGMGPDDLLRAMTLGAGGTHMQRSARDLGRYGMGLKTASFSQAREVVVASRRSPGPWAVRTWDIDHVLSAGDWQLLRGTSATTQPVLSSLTDRVAGQGTVVLWRRLTRLAAAGSSSGDEWAQREFHESARAIEGHLGMVFARYLSARRTPLMITLNGRDVAPWDPFLGGNRWVEALPEETPARGVKVRGYVMPHRSRLDEVAYQAAGGPRGWLDQQGFYVYRRDRLIVAGDWLGLGFRKDDRHALARIAVTVPASDDAEWSLDVRKSRAIPPASLAGPLRRIAKATRARAEGVVNHKGKVLRDRRTVSADATWRVLAQHGRTVFRINREHPLIRDLAERSPESKAALQAVLRMVEQTLPLGVIRVSASEEPVSAPQVGGGTPDDVVHTARQVLEACINRGDAPAVALQRVLRMPPFDEYPDLHNDLTGPTQGE